MPRTVRLNIRISEEERQLVKAKANEVGLRTSSWIRMILLKTARKIKE